VFNIDVSICPKRGGEAKVIACTDDQEATDKILQMSTPVFSRFLLAFTIQPCREKVGVFTASKSNVQAIEWRLCIVVRAQRGCWI
jgi:hypothetical protein